MHKLTLFKDQRILQGGKVGESRKEKMPGKVCSKICWSAIYANKCAKLLPGKTRKKERREKAKSQASEINKELTESPNIQIRIQVQSCRLSQLLSVSDRRFVATPISHFSP